MEEKSKVVAVPLDIPGLSVVHDFITKEEEKYLIESLDALEWSQEIKRRVQHFGFKFSYFQRKVDHNTAVKPMPEFTKFVVERLTQNELVPEEPDQIIVNEYMPGEGIKPHVDSTNDWGECVVSLSLLGGCVMNFHAGEDRRSTFLVPRSLLIMEKEARYKWKHGIDAVTQDMVDGKLVPRGRRVSLTFRKYKPKDTA